MEFQRNIGMTTTDLTNVILVLLKRSTTKKLNITTRLTRINC